MKIHEKIKILRQLNNWTQEEMAEKLRMSANGYGSIERGETNISLSRLEKIATILNIKLINLFDSNEYLSNVQDNKNINLNEIQQQLEKTTFLLTEREKEISYLKEIIELLKQKQHREKPKYKYRRLARLP